MGAVQLIPLNGMNPIGLLAALGALDVVDRVAPEREAALCWDTSLRPTPTITGLDSVDELVEMILADRESWSTSVVLEGAHGERPADIKPDPADVAGWFEAAEQSAHPGDLPLLHALISEGALAGKGDSKPTHLHFTAGQQKFLEMCRTLRDELCEEHLVEALIGPWSRLSKLPVLGWDNEQGERLYALSRKSPSSGKKTGVPGAEWLAFLGLRFLPVVTDSNRELLTTGCARAWKSGGSFTWPLWTVELTCLAVGALLGRDCAPFSSAERTQLGVSCVYRAPIRRADQGGYGSFGPTMPIP